MNHSEIKRLIEQCAAKLENNPLKGLEELAEQFKNDVMGHKAILGLIGLSYPQFHEVISNYLCLHCYLARENSSISLEDHVTHYPIFQKSVLVQLEHVRLLMEARRYPETKKELLDITKKLEELIHSIETPSINKKESVIAIEDAITEIKKHLHRLSDFVITSDEDNILKQLVALRNSSKALEIDVQEYLVNKFG